MWKCDLCIPIRTMTHHRTASSGNKDCPSNLYNRFLDDCFLSIILMNIKISPFSSDRVLDRIPWLMIRDGPCNSAISKWGLCFVGPTHVHHSGICGQNYLQITCKLIALWEIIISMYYEIHILIVKFSNFVLVTCILLMVYLYCS